MVRPNLIAARANLISRVVICGLISLAWCDSAIGGPVDPYIPTTLRKLIDFSDVVLLAKQTAHTPPSGDQKGRVQYTIVRVSKRPEEMPTLSKGRQLELTSVPAGKTDELFLLTGLEDEGSDNLIDWDSPEKVTQRSFKYILDSPSVNKPDKRVPFAEAKRRGDAFTVAKPAKFILHGSPADFERGEHYWTVTTGIDSSNELGGYIDAGTGAFVLLWFKANP